MIRGEIYTQVAESLVEGRIVSIEQIAETNAVRIGAPIQKQIEEIPSPCAQDQVQGAVGLEIGIVAVAQQKQNQRLIPVFEGDFKRGGDAAADG